MPNEEMRRTWTVGGSGWVDNATILDELFAPVTEALVTAAGFVPGQSLLDIGCGTGTLLAVARDCGLSATGIDISPTMVAGAALRVPEARVVADDAQVADLNALPGAPFDLVMSRFGVMFFDDPVAAFANIRSATSVGARLVFACWRDRAENPMFSLGSSVLAERAGLASTSAGAPGPTAFAEPGRLRDVLGSSGWHDVVLEPFDFVCDYGADGAQTRLQVILGTTTGIEARAALEPVLGSDGWEAVLDDVRSSIRAVQGDAPTLRHGAAIWIVTASA